MKRKPYIFITRSLPEKTIAPLLEVARVSMWEKEDEPVPRDRLEEEVEQADGLLTMVSDQIDRDLLESAPHLRVVSNMAVGYDNIDIEAATELGILVCNTPDILTDTTADLTFALLMSVARRIPEGASYLAGGKWKEWAPFLLAGSDVHHKTIGIVGMGRIGAAVAKRATGFDMNILYHNRSRNREAEGQTGARYVDFDELVQESDFVVCLAPLTDETKGMFTYNVFKQMKKSAFFINASRGGLVDERGLAYALDEKLIAGAGLDVFQEEPISSEHPLLSFSNVVALPHIGSASVETRNSMALLASRNIAHVIKGYRPKALVNKEQ
ncbi:2-hydroxyacid dehydrogenase [Alteribacter aurantiacus]|uniref:2-hydroxyacid dehydrogenase n=1 Tax=Alteribacter aurantiacus TaxID=254410 RepID=UPI0003F8F48A|nr:D-glycerate dehydrogenase [Alteribacter aurantiacus]